ncbi:hypothetical protein [Streptomyces kebangsaanensis]|uniref:Toxic cation resistance protein n=1 Tax=Streptomyces kebangsaanensis TaxID=864058 RepID=A0ABW6KLB8_9ACTN|nr:hypothetical protein [Streptomyces kebangsaanensis]
MKLGKALATGVAQEQPPVFEEEVPETPEPTEETRQPQAEAPEEVPAAR